MYDITIVTKDINLEEFRPVVLKFGFDYVFMARFKLNIFFFTRLL